MNLTQLVAAYQSERLLKDQTIRGINVAFRSLISFLGKDPELDEISLDQVVQWRHEMGRSVRGITYNSYLTQILAVFRFARDQRFCDVHHPVLSLKKARVERLSPPTVKDEFFHAAEKFLSQPADPNEQGLFEPRWFWWAIILTLSYTAIRRRQLVELRWKDIDWDDETIHLRKEGSKNGKSWQIPITKPQLEVLGLVRQKTEGICGKTDPDGQIFNLSLFTLRQCGSRCLRADYLSMRLAKLSKIIGVHCTPHKLRHTAATRWLNSTGQLKTVRDILGHSSTKATLEYNHPNMNSIRDALNSLK
jgi:integrase